MTEEERRISLIANAHRASKGLPINNLVESFVSEVKTEEFLSEHGLFDVTEQDIEDEVSLLDHHESAEEIDEEDLTIGMSDEMKGVYYDS
tara:strand:+ start:268 stop:537 length:270 start_codon:yes stop_codon:yes gene_type:complete